MNAELDAEVQRLRRELERLAPTGPMLHGWPVGPPDPEPRTDIVDPSAEDQARAAAYAAMPVRKGSRVL